jgi:lysophospholipase L1-like esterase
MAGLLRAHGRLLLVCLAVQAALALLLGAAVTASRSSLAHSGHWVATKSTLERGVMGAENFLHARQSVAGRRLNLGAWHAYQEVIYRAPLDPVEVRCRFVLDPRAHLSLVFNKTDLGFSGIRVSLDPARPSMLFRASPQGEFLERTPLPIPAFAPKTEHRLAAQFEPGAVTVLFDGASLGRYPMTMAMPQQVGFRGGDRVVVVDDVVFRTRGTGGTVAPVATVYESFEPPSRAGVTAAALGGVLLLNAVVLAWRAGRRPDGVRETLLAATVANGTLAVIAAGVLVFARVTAARYPSADEALKAGESAWRLAEAADIRAAIRRDVRVPAPAGTSRILFLGSSQTWGAGAARASDTMTSVLQRLLDAQAPAGRRYEVVNGGICSVDSTFLLDLYMKEWIRLQPDLVVVNLSNNDRDRAAFAANLRRLAAANRAAGIDTLFVLEANSGEERKAALDEIRERHAAMRAAAAAEGVPVLDMHGHLLENQDRGFLFWDVVHMTSFGQRLAAERLLPDVLRLLEDRAHRTRGERGLQGSTSPPS